MGSSNSIEQRRQSNSDSSNNNDDTSNNVDKSRSQIHVKAEEEPHENYNQEPVKYVVWKVVIQPKSVDNHSRLEESPASSSIDARLIRCLPTSSYHHNDPDSPSKFGTYRTQAAFVNKLYK